MVQIIVAGKWTFIAVRQIWRDYKLGRTTRQRTPIIWILNLRKRRWAKKKKISAKTIRRWVNPFTRRQRAKTPYPTRGWQYRADGEFSWRCEQTVREESNWRGTWVLEVKDLQAMELETVRVPKENSRGFRYQRKPTCHLSFLFEGSSPALLPSEGGQDDLMAWLGKPR